MARTKHKTVHADHPHTRRSVALSAHHQRPYRVRHLASLTVAVLLLVALLLQLGIVIGRSGNALYPGRVAKEVDAPLFVRSSYGFSLSASQQAYAVTATISEAKKTLSVPVDDLADNRPLDQVNIAVRPKQAAAVDASNTLSIRVDPDKTLLARYKQSDTTDNQTAAAFFAPMSDGSFNVNEVSDEPSTLNSVPVQKTIYKHIPRFDGGVSYSIVWAGAIEGRAFAVTLGGLIGPYVTDAFQPVLRSLSLNGAQKVQGASTTTEVPTNLRGKYLSDTVSPAVVRIYHIVCGTLMVNSKPLVSTRLCDGVSGSGFFVRSDGYIATNGHVVVGGAKDIFVSLLVNNPGLLHDFLQASGLSTMQIVSVQSRPDMLASLIARVYDLPDDSIRLDNKQETTLVALGDQPVKYDKDAGPEALLTYKESDHIKRAELVGYNYSSKDLYAVQSGQNQGFSSSDVALLKVAVKNAPALAINTERITQNQPILLFGFPSDADNSLTDNSKLAVSVTDGTISSIRDAAGGVGRLYQSAAAASHGSSGGPAVTENGTVFGLMTYRVSGASQSDASFSYIRDAGDLVSLARAHGVQLRTGSETQNLWQEGILMYASGHYSAALTKFAAVRQAFPAQRLVGEYISVSKEAVAAGKDAPRVPVTTLVVGSTLCLLAIAYALRLMIRHHAYHVAYKNHFAFAGHGLHTS